MIDRIFFINYNVIINMVNADFLRCEKGNRFHSGATAITVIDLMCFLHIVKTICHWVFLKPEKAFSFH